MDSNARRGSRSGTGVVTLAFSQTRQGEPGTHLATDTTEGVGNVRRCTRGGGNRLPPPFYGGSLSWARFMADPGANAYW